MPALATLALIAAAAQGNAPAPLFDAFKAACGNVATFDGIDQAATAAGWTQVPEAQADPRIAAILTKAREAMREEEPDAKVSGHIFRHKADGRDVWLATSRVEFVMNDKPVWANGCRAYDLDAPTAPSAQTLARWVGRAPTGNRASGNAAKSAWEPWQNGASLEITYVPRDNPLGEQFGIQGLILVAQAIGGF